MIDDISIFANTPEVIEKVINVMQKFTAGMEYKLI